MKTGRPPRRALFLDRDGIINHDAGYTHRREEFVFVDGIFALASLAHRRGFALVIVTNQAGIGRGYYTEADFHALMDWVTGEFARQGAPIARVEYCPDHPTAGIGAYRRDSDRRKPAPGMLRDAAAALGLHLPDCIMVGDKASDAVAGQRAGVRQAILVSTEAAEIAAAPPGTLVLPAVLAVTDWLAAQTEGPAS